MGLQMGKRRSCSGYSIGRDASIHMRVMTGIMMGSRQNIGRRCQCLFCHLFSNLLHFESQVYVNFFYPGTKGQFGAP